MMRCFPACFRASKQRKHYKSLNAIIPSQHQSHKATEAVPSTEPIKQEKAIKPITESKAEVEEEEPNCDFEKWVTFDLNVEAKEEPCTKEVDSSGNLVENNEEKKEETPKVVEPILDFIASSKAASFSLNHRYRDCRDSVDDEYEDIGLIQGSDLDEDDDDVEDIQNGVQEESSESLFSLSIDSRKHVSDAEIGEKEVSSSPLPVDKVFKTTGSCQNARNRSQCVHSVLNPIENLSQWKEVNPPPPLKKHHQGKENTSLEQDIVISISPEPSFKLSDPNSKPKSSTLKPAEHEIGVETSLSSWLIESETTPKSNASNDSIKDFRSGKENSPTKSQEDRPILGAWTVEELKQFSASSSPRRLRRSQSPDETPIIGTVGSYWIHTGQNLDYSDSSSSCRGMPITPAKDTETIEDQGTNSKPIPFEARLERACDMGVSEA